MTVVPVFSVDEVRAVVSMADALASARRAFRALVEQTVVSPHPWHLELDRGAVHVKGGSITGERYFAVKAASGFPGNAALGLPTSDGLTIVFDARTGAVAALLLDGGYLTELRTGAAGGLALDLLAAPDLETIAFIGTGGQVRHQIAAALAVRQPKQILIHGRDLERAQEVARWAETVHAVEARGAALTSAAIDAQAIVTATAASAPVLLPGQVSPGAHVTSVGSDAPGKRELDPELITTADLFAVDVLEQSTELGELQGIDLDALRARPVPLGQLLTERPARRPDWVTIADLSGTGAQDAAIAAIAAERLLGA